MRWISQLPIDKAHLLTPPLIGCIQLISQSLFAPRNTAPIELLLQLYWLHSCTFESCPFLWETLAKQKYQPMGQPEQPRDPGTQGSRARIIKQFCWTSHRMALRGFCFSFWMYSSVGGKFVLLESYCWTVGINNKTTDELMTSTSDLTNRKQAGKAAKLVQKLLKVVKKHSLLLISFVIYFIIILSTNE